MSEVYIRSALQYDWLLTALEKGLPTLRDGQPININVLHSLMAARRPTDDELQVAIAALTDIGILERAGRTVRLRLHGLSDTEQFREGVRKTLQVCRQTDADNTRLCAALPPSLNGEASDAVRLETIDLRASILDIITTAKYRIVLASPFWDAETASEISELLVRRLPSPLRVDVLGRFEGAEDVGCLILRDRLTPYPSCALYSWYQPNDVDPFGSQTFHFKAVVADDGNKAYLGSANLTISGLRSRFELGVLLAGVPANQLARICNVVLRVARPIP